jgi:DNA invertase Pin-like site-specific DNA recombinase
MLDRVGSKTRTIRCAIYTRKSSEEGLEQDFNSLDGQREACEAYVLSQRHEGWKALATPYGDGGFSGGSMERPGLKRMLADIHAGLIDIVVVYKVDRLTRSLTDFARMVEVFDARGVSFVSVTQSFNTTSSMGRLTLNVLLSFAQFEREVTGERIRDKIAASKRKGLWMGGFAPMGYSADGRTLKVVAEDAAIISRIFDRFLVLGSIQRVKEELDRNGIMTRAFKSASNRQWGARPFGVGHLRLILTNPIYVGEIAHKGERFKAQHPAIILRETFEAVQQHLALSKRENWLRGQAKDASLLARLLFDAAGNRLLSDHAVKKSRRYRYYATKPDATEVMRIPAGEIEPIIIQGLAARLRDRPWLMATLLGKCASPDSIHNLAAEAATLAAELQHPTASRQREALHRLVEQITIRHDRLCIALKPDPFGPEAFLNDVDRKDEGESTSMVIEIEARFVKKGQSLHLVVPPAEGVDRAARLDKALIKAIARAVTWYDDLVAQRVTSMREIAGEEDVSERYVAQLLPLAFLDPGLVEGALDGEKTIAIQSGDLAKGIAVPMDWSQQRKALVGA